MKFQKQFEKFIEDNLYLLGGNNLETISSHYGILLPEPEYDSSHVQFLYWEFEKFMESVNEKN